MSEYESGHSDPTASQFDATSPWAQADFEDAIEDGLDSGWSAPPPPIPWGTPAKMRPPTYPLAEAEPEPTAAEAPTAVPPTAVPPKAKANSRARPSAGSSKAATMSKPSSKAPRSRSARRHSPVAGPAPRRPRWAGAWGVGVVVAAVLIVAVIMVAGRVSSNRESSSSPRSSTSTTYPPLGTATAVPVSASPLTPWTSATGSTHRWRIEVQGSGTAKVTISGRATSDEQTFAAASLPFAAEGEYPADGRRISVAAYAPYGSRTTLSCTIYLDGILMQFDRDGPGDSCYASFYP